VAQFNANIMNPKYVWAIAAPFDQSDCDIINNIASDPEVAFEIVEPTVVGNDSGWCDMVTDVRFVTRSMIVKLMFSDEKYSTLIRLKFGNRAHLESMILAENTCSLS
jgi:hypothetical protein